jgi:hypothetical protein
MRTGINKNIVGYGDYENESNSFRLGANSISLFLILCTSVAVAFNLDYLHWSYLKGLNDDLAFFIGLFSIIFGMGFYHYWRLGERSTYYLHIIQVSAAPKNTIVLFNYKGYAYGVGYQPNVNTVEFPAVFRKIICVGILFNVALVTLDNSGFEKIRALPSVFAPSKSEFCSEDNDSLDTTTVPVGCELIIRAYKLGYAKNLGICEPKKIDPEEMKVCRKRRSDEPYLHYMWRLLISSVKKQEALFDRENLQKITDKFELQVNSLETLKDYKTYAISAAPRASHHIWTDLPYPRNIVIQKYREYLDPNYCLEHFQKQTNTIALDSGDERKNGKLFEHVYGQLLFNPKSKLTVGYCKEYKIHWSADPDICQKLASKPERVLREESVLPEVNMVLHRRDVANALLTLEEQIRDLDSTDDSDNANLQGDTVKTSGYAQQTGSRNSRSKPKINVKSKIAKSKQQLRKKNEIVSFQCFMKSTGPIQKDSVSRFTLDNTYFTIRTRYFPATKTGGESQISMYNQLAKLLANSFHYSQLTSRSDVKIEGVTDEAPDVEKFLEQPDYLLARLDILKNVDIFLGNSWVLEREDLLKVYPYHVHLQNYVNKFREKYQERHGRL